LIGVVLGPVPVNSSDYATRQTNLRTIKG